MNKALLRIEFSRLISPKDMPVLAESHDLITDVGFAILMEHGKAGTNSTWDHDGNLLCQMTLLKSRSLLQHLNPINHVNSIDGSILSNTFDPFSMSNIVRAQYEAFCNFNNIYIQSKSEDELKLKYFLWVVSGLNYRQRFKVTTDKLRTKKEEEKQQIEVIINEIKKNGCFVQLDAQSQTNILDGIKKRDWQFKIVGNKAHKIAWHEMMTIAGANDMLEGQYANLSLNTHPSNVSVFQFDTMYTEGMQLFSTKMALQLSRVFTAMLIRDYVVYFNNYRPFFNKLPVIPQILVNSINRMFRSPDYVLNNIDEILN